jgi:hypothetical protein
MPPTETAATNFKTFHEIFPGHSIGGFSLGTQAIGYSFVDD